VESPKILFAVDAAQACVPALERAVVFAENNQAALTVVDVAPLFTVAPGMPEGGPISADLQAAVVAERTQGLDALVAPHRGRVPIDIKVLAGTPFLEIVREVLRGGYDLVIRPPEEAGWLGRLLGSDDMHLLRKCPCPVWLIKCQSPRTGGRILAAVDVGDGYPPGEMEARDTMNRESLDLAATLALSEFAELHVAHAWEAVGEGLMRSGFLGMPEGEVAAYVEATRRRHAARLDGLLQESKAQLGKDAVDYLKPAAHLVKGSARRAIPALAAELGADLVVMGTVARTGVPGLIMGNTAEAILQQIGCSVLAIKPAGFATPVLLQG
jgi:nucleotide-binding universal stress UspA family protein